MSEEYTRTVDERTIKAALEVIRGGTFRFRFYDSLTATVEVEGEEQTVRKTENESPWHYYGGSIYTLDEVEELNSTTKDLSILLSNMRANGWDRVIQTPFGNWHPWEDDFIYVPLSAGRDSDRG